MKRILFASQLISVGLLSFLSQYHFPPRSSVNLEIALMLTPSGLLSNVVLGPTRLTPFYFQAQAQQWATPGVLPLVGLIIFSAVCGLLLLTRFPRGPSSS